MDSLYLAWRYLVFHRARTAMLVASLSIIMAVPAVLDVLLTQTESQLRARARTTPLIFGAPGSALELAMNTLYFDDERPASIPARAIDEVVATRFARVIPVYARFAARGFPVVGTEIDYFEFRGLRIGNGRQMALIGECVLGAEVAEALGVGPGDHLVTAPEAVFDLAGVYPLKMTVAGVLEPARSADDRAVFVDIKTAWIIEGLTHGHADLASIDDASVVLSREKGLVTANAKLMQYREITEANIDSFHVHGDDGHFPLSALIAIPRDEKSGALLRGRYLDGDATLKVIEPASVIDGLLDTVFRIKQMLDAVIVVIASATLLAVFLVFALSLRLRSKEMETNAMLGCNRSTTVRLLAAEVFVIATASIALAALLAYSAKFAGDTLVRLWILG
jgi:putative ABC transport system permease protein